MTNIETKKKIVEIMNERGYSYTVEGRNGKDETISMMFAYCPPENQNDSRFPAPTYGVKLFMNCENIEDVEFQFSYAIRTSIDVLQSPKCSSFMNENHFNSLAAKFEREAAILHKYCN